MRIDVISCQPQIFESVIKSSIIGRASESKKVSIHIHNIHDYALDRFRHIDDKPFGGGSGMVIKCQPVFDCIEALIKERSYDEIIYMTPDALVLTQNICNEISLKKNLILLCGHYKGIDQRIRDVFVTREISIGDYVLTGGELPAMVLLDSVVRLIPGVLGDSESALTDSYMDGLLEAPIYTRPATFRGHNVPDVLLEGNHLAIENWKSEEAFNKTKRIRPDLFYE